MRPGGAARLLGLVALIAVHLAGAVHGAAFEGPHFGLAAAACSDHGVELGDAVDPVAPERAGVRPPAS